MGEGARRSRAGNKFSTWEQALTLSINRSEMRRRALIIMDVVSVTIDYHTAIDECCQFRDWVREKGIIRPDVIEKPLVPIVKTGSGG